MNSLYPGIFIPLTKENENYFGLYCQQSCLLSFTLEKNGIGNEVCQAWRINGKTDNQPELGLLLSLQHPHQMEYQKALQICNAALGRQDDELTIPLGNVPAAGLGIVTKSVYIEIEVEFKAPCLFIQHADNLHQALRQPFVNNSKLILSSGASGFEVHGTSPIEYGANRDAWQQHLGKALHKSGYHPIFLPTWSTNTEIADYLQQKSRELQEKNERDYINKITARNAALQAE